MRDITMTNYSSSPSSSAIVRKFTDSVVIGSHEVRDPQAQHQAQAHSQQYQEQQSKKKPRVVSCNFEMEIPTNALRMDMSIIVSTNDNFNSNSSNRICSYETMLPRPSVTYKITICTPRRQEEEAAALATAAGHQEQSTTSTTITTATFRYSSKFTVAKDIDDNVVPYHEWNGSFALGAKQHTPLPLEECSFHQVQGIFTANYDPGTNEEDREDQAATSDSCSTSRKLKKNCNDIIDNEDDDHDSLLPPRKKQRQEETTLNQH